MSLFLRKHLSKFFLEIFYIGLPIRNFPDFKKLVEYILGGDLLKAIGEKEANEKLLASDYRSLLTHCTSWSSTIPAVV